MMKKFFHKIGLSLLTLFLILILGSAIIYAQDYQTYYKNGYEYFLQGKYEMAEQYSRIFSNTSLFFYAWRVQVDIYLSGKTK